MDDCDGPGGQGHHEEESRALRSFLNGGRVLESPSGDVASFFDHVWQKSCAIYSYQGDNAEGNNPHAAIVQNGWEIMIHLLQSGRVMSSSRVSDDSSMEEATSEPRPTNVDGDDDDDYRAALLFQDQALLSSDERSKYGSSLFAAFLDGCSIVMNHADHISPRLAVLCEDLQEFSFPHVYCNTYLTPPGGISSVPPHADDRDVFILQIFGYKTWIVYQRIPVPYPYPHEQVGKNGIPVPEAVLQGPILLQRTLGPGDVLYMPRGYVHVARSCSVSTPPTPSFHATIAMATHDWSLAGSLSSLIQSKLLSIVNYRKAVSRDIGRRRHHSPHHPQIQEGNVANGGRLTERPCSSNASSMQQLDANLCQVWGILRKEISAELLDEYFRDKYQKHNSRASNIRRGLIAGQHVEQSPVSEVVGVKAARRLTGLDTARVRLATAEEKAQLAAVEAVQESGQKRGLHVRADIYDAILNILVHLREDRNDKRSFLIRELRQFLPQPTPTASAVPATQEHPNATTSIHNLPPDDSSSPVLNSGRTERGVDAPLTEADRQKLLSLQQQNHEQVAATCPPVCDVTLLCFVRQCVELGALAVCTK
jgi:Cupin superfamily protein